VFSQTIGQKNTSIFQNCPTQPHADQTFLKNKKWSQKWLQKRSQNFFLGCLGITAQGLSSNDFLENARDMRTSAPIDLEDSSHIALDIYIYIFV
jgi:hypothetical protein